MKQIINKTGVITFFLLLLFVVITGYSQEQTALNNYVQYPALSLNKTVEKQPLVSINLNTVSSGFKKEALRYLLKKDTFTVPARIEFTGNETTMEKSLNTKQFINNSALKFNTEGWNKFDKHNNISFTLLKITF
ncbi:MAG: hypothetical protein ABI543_11835 [Ignavibacteria bacterium]